MHGNYRPFWLNSNGDLEVLDQRFLPFEKRIRTLKTGSDVVSAICNMTVRGAGVIGNVAAFGIYLLAREFPHDYRRLEREALAIRSSRPTAVNLMWAVDRMLAVLQQSTQLVEDARTEAVAICDEDVARSEAIGSIGCTLIERIMHENKLECINILTHCNAGWLAIIDNGSALAPVYEAQRRGIRVHVWVDETRPRNQGANLTSWELQESGIEHTIVADNTGGHLMQHGMVDLVITGADRVTRCGDVANKIGTYLKALAAKDNSVPFYVALPLSTFDFQSCHGLDEIEIEMRSDDEIHYIRGIDPQGTLQNIRITPSYAHGANYAFDITPARLISGLITEAGLVQANETAIKALQ